LLNFDNDALGVDGTSDDDDAQSREAPADQLGTDVEDATTATCADEEESPPTAEENVEFTDLDVASLCLLQLCDNSGAHHGLYDNILAFLHWPVKKKADITKAKGRASFIANMQAKVKCPTPASKRSEVEMLFTLRLSIRFETCSEAMFSMTSTTCVQTAMSRIALAILSQQQHWQT
jgi:hypothetical protein